MAGVSRRTEVIVNVVVCVGAAIVIFGAWAKILHKSFADTMLTVGLLTEAFIFLVYAFIPPPVSESPQPVKAAVPIGTNLTSVDEFIAKAGANLDKLGTSFNKLGATVDQMKDLGDVVKTTSDFSTSAKAASEAMVAVRGTMDKTVGAMQSFNAASESTQQFHVQVQTLNKNLSSLNAIYELELQENNNHLKAMNKYFGNLVAVTDSMAGSIDDAKAAQNQISVLAGNLTKLNSVYGNMLNAMQGRG
ncbi:MAG TPA: gliding motility protein GldL [Phnomibacter sp.]|nr:gliding motility protein GldL [Phnomibacter sp.]